jgi:hypothetical protein
VDPKMEEINMFKIGLKQKQLMRSVMEST